MIENDAWKHIALIVLIIACVILEIISVGAGGLWILAGFWIIFQYF